MMKNEKQINSNPIKQKYWNEFQKQHGKNKIKYMRTLKKFVDFVNEGDTPLKDYVTKVRRAYDGKDTDVENIADILDISVSQVIDIIRYDLKHPEVADELQTKYKSGKKKTEIPDKGARKPRKKIEPKSGKRIYFEMTGSPRSAMTMLPPKERTKDVFATELEKYGFKRSTLNKQCDILIATDLDVWTNKMKKAEDMGIEVTTYAKLIKQYKLFKDNENMEYDEVGQLELWWDGEGPSTWFYLSDAIKDGIIDEKLQLDDDMAQGFAEYLLELGEIDEDSVEWFDLDELAIMIEQDFDETLDKLFDYLMEERFIDHFPTVEIKGEDENGEEWNFSYEPKE